MDPQVEADPRRETFRGWPSRERRSATGRRRGAACTLPAFTLKGAVSDESVAHVTPQIAKAQSTNARATFHLIEEGLGHKMTMLPSPKNRRGGPRPRLASPS